MEICEKSREESKGGLKVMIVSLRNTTHVKNRKKQGEETKRKKEEEIKANQTGANFVFSSCVIKTNAGMFKNIEHPTDNVVEYHIGQHPRR